MQITDTIADLLTRIRNANAAKHDSVEIPASNLKKSICQILADEGYIKSFTVIEDGKQGIIKVTLKYLEGKRPVITGLRRVSKPGLRIYSNAEDMQDVSTLAARFSLTFGKRRCDHVSNWKKTDKYSRRRRR